MSYLKEQIQFLKFDKRLLEINLKNGSLTEREYNQHLDSLKDESSKVEKLTLEGESDSFEMMNGNHHPAAAPKPAPTTPPNNDPFGSGY